MTTYKSLALRGVAAGAIAGVASALVQLLVTEIPIRAALAVEEARESPVTRTAARRSWSAAARRSSAACSAW